MSKRVRIGLTINGKDQWYQRESEILDAQTKKYVVKPFFVLAKREAQIMSEDVGIALVKKLRALRENPFLEDASNQRRVDVPSDEAPAYQPDSRQPMAATIDDVHWYVIKPCTMSSAEKKWVMRIDGIPGLGSTAVYAETELGVLEKAEEAGLLRYASVYQRPAPPQPVQSSQEIRTIRPGDR